MNSIYYKKEYSKRSGYVGVFRQTSRRTASIGNECGFLMIIRSTQTLLNRRTKKRRTANYICGLFSQRFRFSESSLKHAPLLLTPNNKIEKRQRGTQRVSRRPPCRETRLVITHDLARVALCPHLAILYSRYCASWLQRIESLCYRHNHGCIVLTAPLLRRSRGVITTLLPK